jgi:serine/threonine-protein kinase
MAIGPGSRLGPYEVTALIGEGGMGKVWRAHHTGLERDDALKVLPDAFASDPDRLARFQREAKVLASLNHPNIAHVHGLEHADGVQALVMELVEGPTLADRIAQGPIPVDEALPIAKQIAEALEAAHEQGIIHRDLKPANIQVRPDGTVKVLDFGLAKALEPMTVEGADATASPTITSPAMMTGVGVLLGTAAYMSPEQAKGRPADKRSDLWAFGCVLYEMFAGTRPFGGEDVSDVLAEVIKGTVAWDALPSATPFSIRRLLRRCLSKDRRSRLSDAGTARLEIEEGIAELETLASPSPPIEAARSGWQQVWPIAAAALGGAVAVASVVWVMAIGAPREAAQRLLPVKVTSDLGTSASLTPNVGGNLALSPDGSTLAFIGNLNPDVVTSPSLLFVRRLDELAATALAGTDGASAPFFSPDGQWIAFFAEGKLRKVATSGGAVVTLCDARVGRGGSWTSDGSAIVFQPAASGGQGSNGLAFRVAAAGGQPEPVTSRLEGELVHRWPQVLPGDRGVLYTANSTVGSNSDANLVVQPLPTGEPKVVHRGGYFGRYLASGHLVYFRDATLFAAPFDLDRLELTGRPVPVVEDIMSNLASGGGQLAVSDSGTLVYLPGEAAAGANLAPVQWMDRSGKRTPLRSVPAIWGDPRFSPDGRQLALTVADGRQVDLWVYEWDRDILTRLTADGMTHVSPVWTADGSRIVFGSGSGAERGLNLCR